MDRYYYRYILKFDVYTALRTRFKEFLIPHSTNKCTLAKTKQLTSGQRNNQFSRPEIGLAVDDRCNHPPMGN